MRPIRCSLAVCLLASSVVAQEPDYFPLQVGNRWVYERSYHRQYNNPEESEVSELSRGKTIGFALMVGDYDPTKEGIFDSLHSLRTGEILPDGLWG